MDLQPVAEHFNHLFKIQFADSQTLRQTAFNIRHAAYNNEPGGEPLNPEKSVSDEATHNAWHCLFEHRKTGQYGGCVGLTIESNGHPNQGLAVEKSIHNDIDNIATLKRGCFGQISRLAVLSSFKRRQSDKNFYDALDDISADKRQSSSNLPHIVMGLYLGSIALASLCQLKGVYMQMEPQLHQRLLQAGFGFKPIDDKHHGQNRRAEAVFYLPQEAFGQGLSDDLTQLYTYIYSDLHWQINRQS